MSATITGNVGGIKRTGTTVENEPIIKSDGASSDVMQWLSNDESSNVTISEDDSNNLDLVVSSGNVGVGTSSPDRLLELENATNPALRLNNGNSVADIGIASSAGAILTGAADDDLVIARNGAYGIAVGTNGATRLTIDSAGTVLLGTGAGSKGYDFSASGSEAGVANVFCPAGYTLGFGTNNVERMRIDSTGAVSLSGAASGAAALTIGNTTGGTDLEIIPTENASVTLNASEGATARAMILSTGGTARLSISDAGAVTIPSGTVTIGSLDIGHGAGTGGTADTNSTAVGKDALDGSLNTSTHNTAIGSGALSGTMTADADYNTAVGYNGLGVLTSGDRNTALGSAAGDEILAGHNNTAIGQAALSAAAVDNNTAVGRAALYIFTGSGATAVGSGAADSATTANYLTAVGHYAGAELVDQGYDTFLGWSAGVSTIGHSNTFVGAQAGYYAGDTDDCVAIGRNALLGAITTVPSCVKNSTTTITCGSSAVVAVGQRISGTGIPNGTTVATVNSAGSVTSFTISAAATDSLTSSLTFYKNSGNSNIAIGNYALDAATTGASNVAIGHNAGTALTTGNRNIAIGHNALEAEDAATDCIAIGYEALKTQNTDASNNVAIGHKAATALNGGTDSVYVGYKAGGVGAVAGSENVVIGKNAALNATDIATSVFVGAYAGGLGVVTGANNTTIGYAAGYKLTSGASNVLIGRDAGVNLTAGAENVAIGHGALDAADTGTARTSNVAIGVHALGGQATNVTYCVAVGHSALKIQNADVKNTAIGGLAGDAITNGESNTLVGYMAGSGVSGGDFNTAVGHNAYAAGTGSENVCIGGNAGDAAMTGSYNTCVGTSSGTALLGGDGNVCFGKAAGAAMTTGDYNIAIGYEAADGISGNADFNIAIGKGALGGPTGATVGCIAIGANTLLAQNDPAAINLAMGYQAGLAITSGTQNVLIGHQAGSAIATSAQSTAVGYNALKTATGGFNTAIGDRAASNILAGADNVAVGASALLTADGGEGKNTAIGTASLYALDNDASDGNVAVGQEAGRYYNDGGSNTALEQADNCVLIGHLSRTSRDDASNQIVIGYNALGIGNNTIALGDTNIGAIKGQVDFAAYSDRRIKRDITNCDTGLALIEKLQPVTFKFVNSADYPDEIAVSVYKESTREELVSPAVEAAEAVYETVVVQEARDAVAEETRDEVHAAIEEVTEEVTIPAVEAVYEDRVVVHAEAERTETRITQEAREEITSTRHKHSEVEVTETVTREEIVLEDGKYVRKQISEEVTRTERTPLYEECDLYNEDGSICTHCVTPAVEAKDAVVDEDGNEIEPAVEAVAEVRANDVHKVPVMESYISQTAQEEVTETIVTPAVEEVTERVLVSEAVAERTETRVVVEAKDEWTETHITRPAEAAREEVTERRLVSEAVEAADAVYETVTVPADDRPADDDTVRLGLIAQDVQTAMTEAGVEFDIVNESPNGKLSLKYGNLVMPLIKAVQELSARVKTLEG